MAPKYVQNPGSLDILYWQDHLLLGTNISWKWACPKGYCVVYAPGGGLGLRAAGDNKGLWL